MTDVTMIGLGAMGSALARTFLGAGHGVTVWNRTSSKMDSLLSLGASGASSISEAIQASPIIVICIDNYEYSRKLIEDNDLGGMLSGRTLIQLSTGSPKEAAAFEAFIREFGCNYIDGAIMPYPERIGDEDAKLLFAGPEETYNRSLPLLKCLGGDLQYLGSNIKGAAALDMALLFLFNNVKNSLKSWFKIISPSVVFAPDTLQRSQPIFGGLILPVRIVVSNILYRHHVDRGSVDLSIHN